ncbi:MFS transporter [Actinomycetospora termitidis]|uniref:MFS transporter n=1 Tax=Actinomycetospora termitidis TaxID=3053470 RepID=A0ABT7M6H8_9PSEU|nr:MFS transporter [Actinomycetospora sp. Odt1-22]MDL5156138.1 MFS transporter [Actinomycetospora sp. Odt1-22]
MSHADVDPGPAERESSPAEVRRVAISSYLGNTIEFYDFILYGSAAALVFGPLFFSDLSPALATVASFATLASGYVARPLGGIVLGHFGDAIGRKKVLLLTMVLMGLASGAIGLLPTYEQIGVAAPLLLVLLRILQGFAVGGEWGGAVLLTAEHAPGRRRGFLVAIGQTGLATGGLLSTVAMALVALLPAEQLFSWGWRLPFLVSFLLLGLGLYMRLRVSESPVFRELENRPRPPRVPLVRIVRTPGLLLRSVAAALPSTVATALFGTYMISYAGVLGYSRPTILTSLCIAWAAAIVLLPLFGLLTDRIGRRPVFVFGAVSLAVVVYPAFLAVRTGSMLALTAIMVFVSAISSNACVSALAPLLSEMFPTSVRYTGVSMAYQLASLLAGLSPLVASSLVAGLGTSVGTTWIVIGTVAVGLGGAAVVWSMRDTSGSNLRTVGDPTRRPASPATAVDAAEAHS